MALLRLSGSRSVLSLVKPEISIKRSAQRTSCEKGSSPLVADPARLDLVSDTSLSSEVLPSRLSVEESGETVGASVPSLEPRRRPPSISFDISSLFFVICSKPFDPAAERVGFLNLGETKLSAIPERPLARISPLVGRGRSTPCSLGPCACFLDGEDGKTSKILFREGLPVPDFCPGSGDWNSSISGRSEDGCPSPPSLFVLFRANVARSP
mmetsp:Transcript_56063/g.135740  ORF Transcript_56063/g.135740 Transcript_56063/m.135740 type:complete len:211 (-) Transcript_56063:433-1065(-)